MATKIIVDGYNLMFTGQGLHPDMIPDLEEARENLLLKLSRYRKTTGNKILVIFDGGSGGDVYPAKTKFAGIEVLFSRPPQNADELIKTRAEASGGGCIVVTSDNAVAEAIERGGSTAVSSPEFMEKIEFAQLTDLKGVSPEDEYAERTVGTKKKGNPHRLSRKERKRRSRLDKL